MNSIDRLANPVIHLLGDASIRVSVVLVSAWALTLLMRRASGAARHLVWTFAVAGALALPLLEGILPKWHMAVLPAAPVITAPAENRAIAPQILPISEAFAEVDRSAPAEMPPQRETVMDTPAPMLDESAPPSASGHLVAFWIFIAWASGTVAIGFFGAVGAFVVWRNGRRATIERNGPLEQMLEKLRDELNMRRHIRLLLADSAAMPITWGVLRPRILLPREANHWPEDRARSVLLHELAHVRRWDCATQLIAYWAAAIYWFNPLIWLAGRQMRVERERACDDVVIGRGSSATAYAEYLVLLARNFGAGKLQNIAAVAMARRSGLGDRVRAILSANVNRRELNRRAKLIALIAILAVLVPLSAIRLMKKSAAANATLAAETTALATTLPGADEPLPPLPDRLSSKRVPIQVLSPQGRPLRIDSIRSIVVWIAPNSRWQDGPAPQILARYADGWVLVDKQMFVLAQPGERVDLTFLSGGTGMTVTAKYPNPSSRKMTFNALYDPKEIGVDTSAGPEAAKDEVAGEVVDPAGNPVAGAVVSFPQGFGKPIREPVTTGADGVFRFSGFGNQNYLYLQIQKTGYATRLLTDLPVGQGFLLHLDNRARLRGQLISPDGSPARLAKMEITTSKPTARVEMYSPISNLMIPAESDNEGRYDVPLEPGQYEVRVTAANGVGRYDVQIPSGQAVALSGKLGPGIALKIVAIDTVTNKPAVGAMFYVVEMRPGVMMMKKDSMRTSGKDGSVQWDKLMPGPTYVSVQSDVYGRWWTDAMKLQQPQYMRGIDQLSFDLSPGMPAVTVHMEPAVQVTGQVLSPTGQPVANAMVDIAGLQTGDARYVRRTDGSGHFKLIFPVLTREFGNGGTGVRNAIIASDTQHRWANAAGDWFYPFVGQKLSVTLKMTPGARMRGRIIKSNGQPVAHIEVQAQADDQLDRMYYNPRTLTDDGGHFELGPMRGSQYSIYLYANPGRVTGRNDPAPTVRIADGDRMDVGDIKYDGPAPSPVPPGYAQEYGPISPASQSDNANWRHITVLAAASAPPMTNGAPATTPDEEELLGAPAPRGQLSGKVVDDKGHPIAGASIHVWTWSDGPGDTTDDQGRFALRGLDSNNYHTDGPSNVEIRFSKAGFCPKYIPQQPTGLSDLVVVLNSKTYFEGQVTAPDGKPLAFAKVRADQGPKQGDGVLITNVWTETNTDAQGHYKLFVQPDAYDIQVHVPGVGVAHTGKTAIASGEARHLDLPLTSGITFHAKVADSITGKPIAGVRLYSWEHRGIEGRSDSAGNLTIAFMMPGRFAFDVDAKGYARWWSEQAASEWNRRQFIDRGGKWQRNFDSLDFDMQTPMPDITIVVERSVTIRGKVVDPNGRPVSGTTVAPALTGTGNSITGDTRFSVRSKAGGVFEMELPASGEHDYNLEVHDGDYQQWRRWANGVLPPFRTTPGQHMEGVTIALTRPAVVRGQVLDADGHPIAGREVRTVASDLLENRYYDPTVQTDKNGNFALKYVRPGDELIQAAPFFLTPGEAPSGSTQAVTLKEGQILQGVKLTATPTN